MTMAIRTAAVAALALAIAGCMSVERHERALALEFRTTPPGAAVAVAPASHPKDVKKLGTAPIQIEGLVIVRKTYLNGTSDYWLYDGLAALPPNPEKPPYATPAYAAGGDYPLVLEVVASLDAHAEARTTLTVDRARLERLFEADAPPRIAVEMPMSRPGTMPKPK
jgi:hypothetical protein